MRYFKILHRYVKELQKNVVVPILRVQGKYAGAALSRHTAQTFLSSKAVKMYGECILVYTPSKLLR